MCVVKAILSSNGHANSIGPLLLSVSVAPGGCRQCTYCYCDRACLAATKCSNGHGDRIGPFLLWPSPTHKKIYDINNKVR
jgi:hypothetical protein